MTQSIENISSDHTESRPKPAITMGQRIIIGSTAGTAEVFAHHWLWSMKTNLQEGRPFTANPLVLYRGVLANAASMAPITAMQVGFSHAIQNTFFKGSKEASNYQRFASTVAAGALSSFVSCPVEMVMASKLSSGENFYATGEQIVKQRGFCSLFTGLSATAMRESIFASAFLVGTPVIKAEIRPYCVNDFRATLGSGVISGVAAALASQSFDTIKAIQQKSNALNSEGFRQTAGKIYSTGGMYGFFKGSLPRGVRVMSAVTLMGFVKDEMEAVFQQRNAGI